MVLGVLELLGYQQFLGMDWSGDVGDWLWQWVPRLFKDDLTLVLYGLCMIWYCRNELAHGKTCMDVTTAALCTRNRVANFINPALNFILSKNLVD